MNQLDNTGRQVFRATVVVLVMTMISRVLGFLRDATIAWAFGATGSSDAYMVAYTLPYFLQTVLGVALVTVMVPVLSRYLVSGDQEEAWSVTSTILNFMAVFFGVLTLLGILGAGPFMRALAPDFSSDQLTMATKLTRIMFPSLVFVGLGMILSGVLNAGSYFSLPAIAPGLANLLMILAVVFFSDRYFIESLAWGTLAGFIVFFLVQLPNLKSMGFRYRWQWAYSHPEVRKVLGHIPTVLLAIAVPQIFLAINRYLASGLPHGSITALDMANRVMSLPLGVLATSLSTALFPTMSRQAVRQELSGLGEATSKSLAALLMMVVPLTLAMILFRESFIRLLFQRGAFDVAATALTSTALFYFSFGMVGIAFNLVLTRTCYALGNVAVPVLAAVVSIIANIALSVPLVNWMAHGGLALANSLGATINAALLFLLLRRYLPGLDPIRLLRTALYAAMASAPAALVVYLGLHTWPPLNLALHPLIVQTVGLGLTALGLFLVTAWIMPTPETKWIITSCIKAIKPGQKGKI